MRVREERRAALQATVEERMKAKDSNKIISDVITFINVMKALSNKFPLPEEYNGALTLLDRIDTKELSEVIKYALQGRIQKRLKKALEDYKQGNGKAGRRVGNKGKSKE